MGVIRAAFLGAAIWAVAFFTIYGLMLGAAGSGPYCPGMDPEWLGACQ